MWFIFIFGDDYDANSMKISAIEISPSSLYFIIFFLVLWCCQTVRRFAMSSHSYFSCSCSNTISLCRYERVYCVEYVRLI